MWGFFELRSICAIFCALVLLFWSSPAISRNSFLAPSQTLPPAGLIPTLPDTACSGSRLSSCWYSNHEPSSNLSSRSRTSWHARSPCLSHTFYRLAFTLPPPIYSGQPCLNFSTLRSNSSQDSTTSGNDLLLAAFSSFVPLLSGTQVVGHAHL
jgi:hypothetical protein